MYIYRSLNVIFLYAAPRGSTNRTRSRITNRLKRVFNCLLFPDEGTSRKDKETNEERTSREIPSRSIESLLRFYPFDSRGGRKSVDLGRDILVPAGDLENVKS